MKGELMKSHAKLSVALLLAAVLVTLPAMARVRPDKTGGKPDSSDAAALMAKLIGEGPKPASPQEWQARYAKFLDQVLSGLGTEDAKARQDSLSNLEKIVFYAGRPGADVERTAMSKAVADKLGPATAKEARVWLIRMLQHIGRDESVDGLVVLLDDKDADVAECARQAMEKNPSDRAGGALRDALGKAATPERRVAFINALAARKDASAIGAIAGLLGDKDASVIAAAAKALARIGGAEAVKAVAGARGAADPQVRPAIDDAYLLCADGLLASGTKDQAAAIYEELYVPAEPARVRVAALRGLVLAKPEKAQAMLAEAITGTDEKLQPIAVRLAADLQGAEATKTLVSLLPKVRPAVQAALVTALGSRGDAAAKPAIIEAAKSGDETVRTAAYQALGNLGDGTDVPMLAKVASGAGGEADAARQAIVSLRAQDVDQALAKLMADPDAKVRVEVVRSLGARKSAAATPVLLKAAQDADESVQVEALSALGSLGGLDQVQPLVDIVLKTQSNRQRDAAEGALSSIVARQEKKDACGDLVLAAARNAETPAKCALIRVMRSVGTAKALAAVRDGLKDPKVEVKEAAIRALSYWTEPAALPDLLAIAKDSSVKPAMQYLALQGYVRLIGGPGDRPADEKLKMYQEAMTLAKRPDEKRLIMSGASELRSVQALRLVAPCLDEKGVQEEAASAAVSIADGLDNSARDEVVAAMEKVLQVTRNKKVLGDAQRVLNKVKKTSPPKGGGK